MKKNETLLINLDMIKDLSSKIIDYAGEIGLISSEMENVEDFDILVEQTETLGGICRMVTHLTILLETHIHQSKEYLTSFK